MKKNYILGFMILGSTASFAQTRTVGEEVNHFDRIELQDRSTDKINFVDRPAGFATNGTTNGGFTLGTNGYFDVAAGNLYTLPGTANVTGAYVWYGAIESVSATMPYNATIYNGDKVSIGVSNTKTIADIDTTAAGAAGWLEYSFTTPVSVADSFYVMISVDTVGLTAADTVALVGTTDGSGGMAINLWNDGSFVKYSDATNGYGENIDACIMVLVENLGHTNIFDQNVTAPGVYTTTNDLVINGVENNTFLNEVVIYDLAGKVIKRI
jgi:hypothetical protein